MSHDVVEALLDARLPGVHKGKVRSTYAIPGYPHLLLVLATNRLSTHNVVHRSQVPQKGAVLTALTIFWFRELFKQTPNHLVAAGREIYRYLPMSFRTAQGLEDLEYRAIIVDKLDMISIEFVVRAYLTGSLYAAYTRGGDPYGLALPSGLVEMSPLPNGPLLTPTDKSETDDPLLTKDVLAEYPRESALALQSFNRVQSFLLRRGWTLVDSKLEIGVRPDGTICVADEVFTPDSSRYALTESIVEGRAPPWHDKQVFRDKAEQIWGSHHRAPLQFPREVVNHGRDTYLALLAALTGYNLLDWAADHRFDYHRS